jgi:hypothetical protein
MKYGQYFKEKLAEIMGGDFAPSSWRMKTGNMTAATGERSHEFSDPLSKSELSQFQYSG